MTIDLKDEILRMLHPRWTWLHAGLMRDNGHSLEAIGEALIFQETTCRVYAERGRREWENFGTLYFLLSTRARKFLDRIGVDTKKPWNEMEYSSWLDSYPWGGRIALRNEILNAVDILYDISIYRGQLAGERP